jgi:hypothetical protein
MDENRKKELFGQLRSILKELKEGDESMPSVEQLDDGILRIYIKDAFGTKERVGG